MFSIAVYTVRMAPNSQRKTPRKQFLKFSTPLFTETWWRLKVETEDLRWIQRNLGKGLDFQKRFGAVPSHVARAAVAVVYPDGTWSDRVNFVEGESAPRVLVSLGGAYNYHEAHVTAREKRDPYLAPHGQFRRLQPDYHKHAFQFMRDFGPLSIDSPTRFQGDTWWLSLADFWARHARFVAMAKLWEDRFDQRKLHEHWAALEKQHETLDRAGAAPLGYIPDPIHKSIQFCQMPWQRKDGRRLSTSAEAILARELVYKLIQSELILHTQDCVLTWIRKDGSSSLDEASGFEPTPNFTSLWGVIWHLFGLDTRMYGWRLCQLCGKVFYPKDRRSMCCRTEHQSLWSKRVWAREHRTAARIKNSNLQPH